MEITEKKFGTFFTINVYCELPPNFTEEEEDEVLAKLEDENYKEILKAKINLLLEKELDTNIYVVDVELV
jgi:hypothetical protein